MKYFKKNQISAALGAALTFSTGSLYAGSLSNNEGWIYDFYEYSGYLQSIQNKADAALTDICSTCDRTYVDNNQVGANPTAVVLDGRGSISGVETINGVEVTRQLFVPEDGNFIRGITTLTNPTGGAIVVVVRQNTNLSATAGNVNVVDTSSGDAATGTNDTWFTVNGDATDIVLGTVFGDGGGSESIDSIDAVTGTTSHNYEWQAVSVPAGGTVKFMTFTLGEADDASANASAANLAALGAYGVQMRGISDAEKAQIVNWGFTDADADGMVDSYEAANGITDPAADKDGDGLTNLEEYNLGTNPSASDTDGDGLSDSAEITAGTNPGVVDTDGDGISDGDEVAAGTDPLNTANAGFLIINNNTPSHSPDVQIDSLGRIHVVWMDEGATGNWDVMYQLLDNTGEVLIDTTQISDSVSDSNNDQGHPSIVVDGNNHAYVAWFTSGNEDAYIVGLDPAKAALDGTASTVANLQKFAPVTFADCKRSDLAVDTNGNIHMVCANAADSTTDVAVIAADGTVVKDTFPITSSDNYAYYAHSRVQLTLDSNNMAHVTYSDDTDEQAFYAMVDGVKGDVLIDATRLSYNPNSGGNSYFPSIDIDTDGKAYVVWGDNIDDTSSDTANADIFFATFDPTREAQDGNVGDLGVMAFSSKNLTPIENGEHAWYVTSAMGSDGEIVITYNTDGGNGIAPRYFMKVDKTGTITTPKTRLGNDGDQHDYETYGNFVSIAETDTNVVAYVTDEDPAKVIVARLDGSAFPVAAAPAPVPAPASSSSSGLTLSLWSLLGLSGLVGLLRLRRRK